MKDSSDMQDDEVQHKGLWFLPEEPERLIPGTLVTNPATGALLDLNGPFRTVAYGSQIDSLKTYDLVLGIVKGKEITLYNCLETSSNFSLPRSFAPEHAYTASLSVGTVFIGSHFQNKASVQFSDFVVSYTGLSEWTLKTGFRAVEKSQKEFVITYETQPAIPIAQVDDYTVSIVTEASGNTPIVGRREANLKESLYAQFEFSASRHYEDGFKVVSLFANFLTLAIGRPIYPLKILADSRSIEIFLSNKEVGGANWLFASEMLFSLDDSEDIMSKLFKNYVEKQDQMEQIHNLYLGTLYNPRMYLSHTFLSLAQAAETYHRQIRKGGVLTKPEYKVKKTEILQSVPAEHKDWLEKKLQFGNELTLQQRMEELLRDCSDTVQQFIGDAVEFATRVKATRNYLTHFSKKTKSVAEGDDLIYLTYKPKILIEECILRELGFNREDVNWVIGKSIRTPQLI
jgi:ApeA-like protein/HEPN superfamily Apea-like protein